MIETDDTGLRIVKNLAGYAVWSPGGYTVLATYRFDPTDETSRRVADLSAKAFVNGYRCAVEGSGQKQPINEMDAAMERVNRHQTATEEQEYDKKANRLERLNALYERAEFMRDFAGACQGVKPASKSDIYEATRLIADLIDCIIEKEEQ